MFVVEIMLTTTVLVLTMYTMVVRIVVLVVKLKLAMSIKMIAFAHRETDIQMHTTLHVRMEKCGIRAVANNSVLRVSRGVCVYVRA